MQTEQRGAISLRPTMLNIVLLFALFLRLYYFCDSIFKLSFHHLWNNLI